MTPEALREEVAGGRLRAAYLLAGEEPLLRDDALALLRDAVLATGVAEFNFDRLDGQTTTPAQLVDSVHALPVMAARRLVVLREPAEKRAAARGLLDALAELVAASAPESERGTVLVVLAAKPDRRQRWVKAFEASGTVVDCEPLRGARTLIGFVRGEAQRQGVELGSGAAELLVERIGPQLLILRRELEKAALFAGPTGRVTREHISVSTSDIAVVAGSLKKHFRRLLRVRTGGGVRGSGFVVRKLEAQAGRYRPERLRRCLGAIHDCDEVLKGRGGHPQKLALERLVIGLAS
jgi:DNA polymerase-3 subunit delta